MQRYKMNTSSTKCTTELWKRYNSGLVPVITDIKCKSPGEGDLLMGRDPVELAKSFSLAGVPVISVVTENEHYGGSPDLLYKIAKAVSVPILRKDFIKTKEELRETVDIGASAALLICSMLKKDQLFMLIEESLKLGLEPLVETHSEAEIANVRSLDLTFIGINNRNIVEFEVDDGNVNTTEKLAGMISSSAMLVSESSISSPEDVERAIASGAHSVLVGTAILKSQDPVEMFKRLSINRR